MHLGRIVKEILVVVCAYLVRHILNGTGHAGVGRELKKVADIARPATEVGCVLIAGMVCHIHASEHMTEFNFVSVGESKAAEVAELSCRCSVGGILLRNVICESYLFLAAERCPRAGGILFDTAANVVYHKRYRIFAGMLTHIRIRISLKSCERGQKVVVLSYVRR